MKTLSEEKIEELRKNYPLNWFIAMTSNPEKVDSILSLIDRNKDDIDLTFEEAFFSPNGFNIYEKDGERRIFCAKSRAFEEVPLNSNSALGDWGLWLNSATLIKRIK